MKKVLSIVLAAVMAFGMATVAFAAASKINGINNSFDYSIGSSGGADSNGAYDMTTIPPETVLKLYLNVNDFSWDNGNPTALTSSHLNTVKYTVKKKVSKGSNVIDDITLEKDGSSIYIKVKFIEEFVSTSDQDFDFTIYLAKSGTKISGTEVQIYGTMENDEIPLDDYDDEVDLSGHAYAKAEEYIKAIKVDTGNGLFINAKMFDGKKYYARSNLDVTASDSSVLNQYPEIEMIYTLNTINFSGSGNTVEFDVDDKYFVYNADGQYVGNTADTLPFSSKYYLANAKIDLSPGSTESGTEPIDVGSSNAEPVEDPGTSSDGGGGGGSGGSGGVSPNTGASGFIGLAAAMSLVALAAGIVTMKK